ncbi:unnamed protein product, partial [Musa hybrid cultivar]
PSTHERAIGSVWSDSFQSQLNVADAMKRVASMDVKRRERKRWKFGTPHIKGDVGTW